VSATLQSDAHPSALPIQSDQQDNTLTLTIASKGNTGVLVDITTPLDTNLNVQADSANIQFAGSLNPNDTYQLATKTGSISASISANSAFRLSTIVDNGDYTNDFGSDVVGNVPRATLALLAYNSSILIQKS
jgi:hypothetical protein